MILTVLCLMDFSLISPDKSSEFYLPAEAVQNAAARLKVDYLRL